MTVQTIGIDLGKTTFHLVALDGTGKILLKKRFSRTQLFAYAADLPACLIGMEACCGAHHLGRTLSTQGQSFPGRVNRIHYSY